MPARPENVDRVTDFVNAQLAEWGCPDPVRIQVDVAVDEIFSNIARYAYRPATGPATVRVDVRGGPLRVVIAFIDHGVPFDPLAADVPDTAGLPAKDRPLGGLGLFMVKRTMDGVEYSYRGGQNILPIRKHI